MAATIAERDAGSTDVGDVRIIPCSPPLSPPGGVTLSPTGPGTCARLRLARQRARVAERRGTRRHRRERWDGDTRRGTGAVRPSFPSARPVGDGDRSGVGVAPTRACQCVGRASAVRVPRVRPRWSGRVARRQSAHAGLSPQSTGPCRAARVRFVGGSLVVLGLSGGGRCRTMPTRRS